MSLTLSFERLRKFKTRWLIEGFSNVPGVRGRRASAISSSEELLERGRETSLPPALRTSAGVWDPVPGDVGGVRVILVYSLVPSSPGSSKRRL